MTRPPELPSLAPVRVAVPPRGFDAAVRAAGRRRWRTAGGTASALTVCAALLLASPGGSGTAGLTPAEMPAHAPRPASTAPPSTSLSQSPAVPPGERPAPAPDPGSAPTSGRASASAAPDQPGPGYVTKTQAPIKRDQKDADLTMLATCGEGTRFGQDWCLIARAQPGEDGWVLVELSACALSPAATRLAPASGHEVDFEVKGRWSSGLGRSFPGPGADVVADYGRCTRWWTKWDGVGDDGHRLPSGSYTLVATLRLKAASPSDAAGLVLA